MGKGGGMVIRAGARQIKAKTTPKCQQAQGEFGAVVARKRDAENGDKMHSKKIVRCSTIYSSSEQLATGLKARWYGECTGLREPRVAEEALHS